MHKLAFATLAVALAPALAHAEEGMWPYNLAPTEQVKAAYGFEMTPAFLEHAQLSSVRFNNGGSGSFVSPEGLVMTNQHVGRDCIQKLTTEAQDLLRDGFYAATQDAELKCPDLELNQTVAITDVTAEVNAAAEGAADDAAKNKAKKAKMGELEKGCADEAAGIRCDVVTLYSGGAYHLYRYQKYTDVRLVWAPENDAKHFGGEPDNFNFPRMSLDASFFRVWKDGKPVDTSGHFFKWSKDGAKDGDLVFVSGHPGSTGRQSTPAELGFLRSTAYPFMLESFTRMQENYGAYMAESEQGKRVALADWLRAANAKKAIDGYLKGLNDEGRMRAVREKHEDVKKKLAALPEAERARLLEAWPKLAEGYQGFAKDYPAFMVTEGYVGPSGTLLSVARHLVRLGDELPKKDGDRLMEYRDAALPSLELSLFSEAPIDDGLEVRKLTLGLVRMQEVLGANDATVKAVLAGKTPDVRARELVAGTKLKDVAFRRQLKDGGKAAVDASGDPLIAFVKAYDNKARELRKKSEDGLEATKREYGGRIAEAFAKAFGQTTYPDATFTLRLSYGVVKGYEENGKKVRWATQVGDLYRKNKRAKNQDPYQLPQRFFDHMGDVDFTVPYNFVSTCDIIGGNSGSPMFNSDGEIVGLIFDGNLYQLGNRFLYRSDKERSVAVHSQGLVHVLEHVYGAQPLVAELVGRPAS